jgi:hypothetical protein
MRESVLRDLARRAATDAEFLKQARQDLQGTLAKHGYHLTDGEMRLVENLRQHTAEMSDEELAHTLASGLRERTGTPPSRPAPRAGAVRVPQDQHDPEADGGSGV